VHGKSVHAVAYAGNGGAVCAGGEDGVVTVWSRTAEEKPARLEGHGGPVLSLIPLPGGRLVSGSADTTALVWKLPGGQR
jgi:WD40 repeat protein